MSKKILGSIGLIAGLGLLSFLGYHYLINPGKVSSPPGAFEGVIRPAAGSLPRPANPPLPQDATPAFPGPAAPPAVSPSPPPEKETAALPALESAQEPGLLAGKFRRYKDARGLLARIQRQQVPAFIRKEGNRYGVWAGPFATNREMEQARRKLKMALRIAPQTGTCAIPVPK